jgi:hypothetical protein
MPIAYETTTARFEDHCSIEEAETLFAWVRERSREGVPFRLDLSCCMHLHTALLQIVLLTRAERVLPADGALRDCLAPVPSVNELEAFGQA